MYAREETYFDSMFLSESWILSGICGSSRWDKRPCGFRSKFYVTASEGIKAMRRNIFVTKFSCRHQPSYLKLHAIGKIDIEVLLDSKRIGLNGLRYGRNIRCPLTIIYGVSGSTTLVADLKVSVDLRNFAGLSDPVADASERSLAVRFPKLVQDVDPDVGGPLSKFFCVDASEEKNGQLCPLVA